MSTVVNKVHLNRLVINYNMVLKVIHYFVKSFLDVSEKKETVLNIDDLWFNCFDVIFPQECDMICINQKDHHSCPLQQIALIDSNIMSHIVPLQSLDF